MADPATLELTTFLETVWGIGGESYFTDKTVFCYVPVEKDGIWRKQTFVWPKQKGAVVSNILRHTATGFNVFFSPSLFKAARPVKENVYGARYLWADFDGNAPTTWEGLAVPSPTFIVQSSLPGHEHCYWALDQFIMDTNVIEDRNRAIAYNLGADTSGWDADQVLRPIRTQNYKRNLPVVLKAKS